MGYGLDPYIYDGKCTAGRTNQFAISRAVSVQCRAAQLTLMQNDSCAADMEDDDEEDYSASVCAILERRATSRRMSRRRNRRTSSPFSPDVDSGNCGIRRRSSVFTTSSGE